MLFHSVNMTFLKMAHVFCSPIIHDFTSYHNPHSGTIQVPCDSQPLSQQFFFLTFLFQKPHGSSPLLFSVFTQMSTFWRPSLPCLKLPYTLTFSTPVFNPQHLKFSYSQSFPQRTVNPMKTGTFVFILWYIPSIQYS